MDLDLELSRMMETSVMELSVPVAVIVAESNRRGRRRRLARRLRVAGAALTVVALAAVGANVGLSTVASNLPAHSAGPAGVGVGVGVGVPPPTTSPSPSDGAAASSGTESGRMLEMPPASTLGRPPSSGTSAPKSLQTFTPEAVFETLGAMLPADYRLLKDAVVHPGPLPSGTAGVVMKFVDGTGQSATLEVTMRQSRLVFPKNGQAPTDPSDLPFQCAESVLGNGARTVMGCEYGFLTDGTWEMVESNGAVAPPLYNYRVRLWRIDGTVLEFTEYSGTRDFTGDGETFARGDQPMNARTTPPIPMPIWRGVAESQDWRWFTLPKD
ncbi:hypothetical protein ACFYST_05190 [Kitasatospora sp. NPDC004614]|uniref:hypothetical protein n=1 Tax=unclassified Kitasatospora TaxID=2633591 RepID=UPI00367A371A